MDHRERGPREPTKIYPQLNRKTVVVGEAGELGEQIADFLKMQRMNPQVIGENIDELRQLARRKDCLVVHTPFFTHDESDIAEYWRYRMNEVYAANHKIVLLTGEYLPPGNKTTQIVQGLEGLGCEKVIRDFELETTLPLAIVNLLTKTG